jgi:hypothetical protein
MKERNFFIMVDELPEFIQRWVFGIKPPPFRILHGAYIQPVNEFLAAFVNSTEAEIQLCADDLRTSAVASLPLALLQGLDYETIRLRLRTISSLNPVVNLSEETGTITLVIRRRTVVLHSVFTPKGASIILKKG